MNLAKRKKNLELICEGTNIDYLQEHIDNDLLQALSDHQSMRVERALSANMCVAPVANSIYSVISINESGENSTYQTNTRVSSCTCSDFLYRCDYENGERCKHLWRIQFLSNLNALPNKNQNPTRWFFTEIEQDKLILRSKGQRTASKDLEQLQYQILKHDPRTTETHRSFLIQWLDILREAIN